MEVLTNIFYFLFISVMFLCFCFAISCFAHLCERCGVWLWRRLNKLKSNDEQEEKMKSDFSGGCNCETSNERCPYCATYLDSFGNHG